MKKTTESSLLWFPFMLFVENMPCLMSSFLQMNYDEIQKTTNSQLSSNNGVLPKLLLKEHVVMV